MVQVSKVKKDTDTAQNATQKLITQRMMSVGKFDSNVAVWKQPDSCIFTYELFLEGKDPAIISFMNNLYKDSGPEISVSVVCKCGRSLRLGYLYILDSLIEAGLLRDDYEPMCCYCNALASVGFCIPDEWDEVHISEVYFLEPKRDNICYLDISFHYIPTKELGFLSLRIHDIKLALKTGRVFNDVGIC